MKIHYIKKCNSLFLFPAKTGLFLAGLLFVSATDALPSPPDSSRTVISSGARKDILLADNWRTIADDHTSKAFEGFENPAYNDQKWVRVDVPHNWDDYGGYRTEKHGNRHGYAGYRKYFTVDQKDRGKRFFLWFEGVGSYATVWINGHEAGKHAGGRTSFTLDVTDYLFFDKPNLLAVRADHPAGIQDLPWVCGGCSPEYGFSEGSQPMGIFRPVHLMITAPVRIEPFGVHIWNDKDITEKSAVLHLETEIKNYGNTSGNITLITRITDRSGKTVMSLKEQRNISPGALVTITRQTPPVNSPHLWSPFDPYLYSVISEISVNKKIIDRTISTFGIRWIDWFIDDKTNTARFLINGKPFFINGIAEYEHMLGQSHAFSDEQIRARVMQIQAAGFNAFRDAHQPHNLRYQEYWDNLGILWWPQMAAHIWFDTPAFRTNFKNLLTDWIKERRNSPSIILWGLENESSLPQSFAEECSALIRQLDPTASSQRKITTCNGGKGTDWNVPQNWTGTYGGDPSQYAGDLKKQQLVGEYGAWRSIDLHTEGTFDPKGPLSEDRMSQLLETKIRLADSVNQQCDGHFFWVFNSHDNPGRTQNGEGLRDMDKIGPVNYKGLFTSWDEPLDAFYLFRANFVSNKKAPMVYIVSHTWPDRWTSPGIKSGITVYSNCDEVELFNDSGHSSLGIKKRGKTGTHFQWDNVNIQYNVLYAEGRVNGKIVAKDCIVLHHLPSSPHFKDLITGTPAVLKPRPGYHYLYRIDCGGPDYRDKNGNLWLADASGEDTAAWSSHSWADTIAGLPPHFASQRRIFDPVAGTDDWGLFQTFRFGRHRLNYTFPVADGDYLVELYFIEPWFGTGGGMDCSGWRTFDVAINDSIVLKNLDIWKEAGRDKLLKKEVMAHVSGGKLIVSFPKITAGQAVISAIAIAANQKNEMAAKNPESLITQLKEKKENQEWSVQSWLDTGNKQYANDTCTFHTLPSELYGSEWIRTSDSRETRKDTAALATFVLSQDADVYVALNSNSASVPSWMQSWTVTKQTLSNDRTTDSQYTLYKKSFRKNEKVSLFENGQAAGSTAGMYTVIVHKPTVLELTPPPSRSAVTYEAEDAAAKHPLKENSISGYSGKGYASFREDRTDTLEWVISVGVGDTYGLRFRYINNTSKDIAAKLQVISEDGNLMSAGSVYFDPAHDWDKVSTTTGTSINAGTYRIRLIVTNGSGLVIDNLRVQ